MKREFIDFFKEQIKVIGLKSTLAELRQMGASEMESTFLICGEMNLSLKDASLLLQETEVWHDTQKTNDLFRENLGNYLEGLD